MNFILVNLAHELDSLDQLISSASKFIDAGTSGAWPNRRSRITSAIAANGANKFQFGEGDKFKFKTVPSKSYKGGLDGNAPLVAEVYFGWNVEKCPTNAALHRIESGSCNVQFYNQAGALQRHFHFDVCQGGADGADSKAQHPIVHFQYKICPLSDLPRVPSLLFSPSDVLEHVLLELWPDAWPAHSVSSPARAALSAHYVAQKKRIEVIGRKMLEAAAKHKVPLRGLQMPLAKDLIM